LNKFLLIPVLFIFCQKAKAQFSDSVFYYAGITSTGSFNKTVTNSSYLFNNALRLGTKKKSVVMNSVNKWLYGAQNERQTNNDFSSAWDINLYKTFPHFNYWGMLNYVSSYSLKINHQFQGGIGVAYNVIDRPNLIVNLSDGVIYDYSDLNTAEGPDIYGTPRNSFRLHIKWNVKDRLVFRGNCFLQNSLQDAEDYIIKSDASLSIKVKKWLSLTSAFTYNRMTRNSTENLFITYGITLEKYF
jgi:hypothetical protein